MNGVLLGAAATVAVVHTAVGVDHALPFVVLSRVQGWSFRRTMAVTALCGLGHIASAVVLGLVALGLGVAVEQLGALEEVRGQLGLWLLVGFGLVYAAVAGVRLGRGRHHHHHHHGHPHPHSHDDDRKRAVTAWTLFIVLVFGPCEALVPLLLAPGVMQNMALLAGVIVVFGTLTVLTMLVLVALGSYGSRLVRLERWLGPKAAGFADVAAGLTIACTGVAVGLLGL